MGCKRFIVNAHIDSAILFPELPMLKKLTSFGNLDPVQAPRNLCAQKKTSAEWNPADCIAHCADYIAITMENPADNYADNPTEVACVLSVASSLNRNFNFVEVARIRHNQSKTLLLRSLNRNFNLVEVAHIRHNQSKTLLLRSLNRNFLPILDIDTACRVLDLAALEVVVGSIGIICIICIDSFNAGFITPENTFFLLVEHRTVTLQPE